MILDKFHQIKKLNNHIYFYSFFNIFFYFEFFFFCFIMFIKKNKILLIVRLKFLKKIKVL